MKGVTFVLTIECVLWATAALAACTSPKPMLMPLPHRPDTQSWDQERLKEQDHGCPSAVFIAPDGNLQQCGVTLRPYTGDNCLHDPDFGGHDVCQLETQL